jgi:hypothetical protein
MCTPFLNSIDLTLVINKSAQQRVSLEIPDLIIAGLVWPGV